MAEEDERRRRVDVEHVGHVLVQTKIKDLRRGDYEDNVLFVSILWEIFIG